MRIELTQLLWLEQHELSLSELAELSGLGVHELKELIGAGAIRADVPGESATPQTDRFGAQALQRARRARRLREDFELDTEALLLVMSLLERIENVEAELRAVRARLPR